MLASSIEELILLQIVRMMDIVEVVLICNNCVMTIITVEVPQSIAKDV
jgi:hypothetical protein